MELKKEISRNIKLHRDPNTLDYAARTKFYLNGKLKYVGTFIKLKKWNDKKNDFIFENVKDIKEYKLWRKMFIDEIIDWAKNAN